MTWRSWRGSVLGSVLGRGRAGECVQSMGVIYGTASRYRVQCRQEGGAGGAGCVRDALFRTARPEHSGGAQVRGVDTTAVPRAALFPVRTQPPRSPAATPGDVSGGN